MTETQTREVRETREVRQESPVDTTVISERTPIFEPGTLAEETTFHSLWGKLPIKRWLLPGRMFVIPITDEETAPTVADSFRSIIVPSLFDGAFIQRVELGVVTTSASGGPLLVQLAIGANDLLLTRVQITDGQKFSNVSGTTQPVVSPIYGVLRAGDQLDIDIDDIGDGNAFGWTLYIYLQ